MRLIALFCLTFLALPLRAEVTVFAAASLRGALDQVNESFDGDVIVSYASSAVLARQIAQGAPADVFLSAHRDWVSYLQEDPYTEVGESIELLGNALVFVRSKDAQFTMLSDIADRLEGRNLAIGISSAVPAGIYAKQALESFGLWRRVQQHLVQTDNVRAALALVSLGEVDYAIVYRTDALAAMSSQKIQVLGVLPDSSHDRIVYQAARISNSAEAKEYFSHLQAKSMQQVFARQGFVPTAYINAEGGYE